MLENFALGLFAGFVIWFVGSYFASLWFDYVDSCSESISGEEAEEEDRITRELIEAMEADLFGDLDEYGALEGAHGRKA